MSTKHSAVAIRRTAPTQTTGSKGGERWCSTPHGACPDYGDRVERVVCYDGVDAADSDVVLEPSADAVAEGESISFALENGSGETLQTNFYNWRVDKCVGDGWYHVAPLAVNQPLMSLDPGESHTWTATIDNGDLEDGTPPRSGGTEAITLSAVGKGHYAFRARGWFESESYEEATAFAAPFEIEGEPLELAPSDAVAGMSWDDETLVAASTRGDSDDEHYRLGAFELERVDEPDAANEGAGSDAADEEHSPQTVIVEQLYRQPRLRDAVALALEHDADRVRLEEYDATHPIFGSRSDGVYEFRDEYYRVSTRELEE